MKIQNINFKKAFIALFALCLVFAIVSTAVELSNGRWEDALTYEQHRVETNQGRTRFGGQHEREGRFGRHGQRQAIVSEANLEQTETTNELPTPPRSVGDRVLYSTARHYVRVTSSDFGILTLLGYLLRVAFVALLTLWVYADSKKHERNTLLWTGLTLFTHGLGWIIYVLVRERRKVAHKRNA